MGGSYVQEAKCNRMAETRGNPDFAKDDKSSSKRHVYAVGPGFTTFSRDVGTDVLGGALA